MFDHGMAPENENADLFQNKHLKVVITRNPADCGQIRFDVLYMFHEWRTHHLVPAGFAGA